MDHGVQINLHIVGKSDAISMVLIYDASKSKDKMLKLAYFTNITKMEEEAEERRKLTHGRDI